MKIISKHSDFYDHYAYLYGCTPDESIRYNRVYDVINCTDVNTDIYDWYKNHIYNLYTSYNYKTQFLQTLVGIYPYVYYCAYFKIQVYANMDMHEIIIPVPFEYVNNEDLQGYIDLYTETHKLKKIDVSMFHFSLYQFGSKNDKTVKRITRCPEIFNKIGCPVFKIDPWYLHKNPIIVKDTHLFKCFDKSDIDRNIYSNIEQFLSYQNTKPISEPDNKTKIINAGFDTKTSFRNM